MYEKVNPSHPDKLADRIAGALVDYAYTQAENPRIAVEVLLGHGVCHIIAETSVHIPKIEVCVIVNRIAGIDAEGVMYQEVAQDERLAENQSGSIRCGDNGIFKGVPVSDEEYHLAEIARDIYEAYPYDGKYIYDAQTDTMIVCQSNATTEELKQDVFGFEKLIINPLGFWTGGSDVDSGATNRKLGSDMGRGVTGGGLHGKDLSKADVSVNIYAHLKAQETGKEIELCCAIGDDEIDGKPYSMIVDIARQYIKNLGGFEKFAEWGLIR